MPTAYAIAPGNDDIMTLTISAILAGAVYGDHCTYISDTTILRSGAQLTHTPQAGVIR